MKTINLIHYYNDEFDEEEALYNADTKELIIKGDYYHDKISEYIKGILHGLTIAGVNYNITATTLTAKDEMFKTLKFYE